MKDVRNVRGSAQKKIEKLRQLLSGVFSELTNFDEVNLYCLLMLKNMMADYLCFVANWLVRLNWFQPIRSPLAPTLLLTGVVPQESSIFKSALNPLRLTFKTANGGTSKIIYKKGDDLRQDQLVSN
jgi:phosphatidylinositol 3-kinase